MASISNFTIYSREPGSIYCELDSSVQFTSNISLTPGGYSGNRVIYNDSHAYYFVDLPEGVLLNYTVNANFIDGTSDTRTGTVLVRSTLRKVSPVTTLSFTATSVENNLLSIYPYIKNDPMIYSHLVIRGDGNFQIKFKGSDAYINLLANQDYTYYPVSDFYFKTTGPTVNVFATFDNNVGA
jgi:hypothetical protein